MLHYDVGPDLHIHTSFPPQVQITSGRGVALLQVQRETRIYFTQL